MGPFLSFLVPAHGHPEQLRETLLSLEAQTSTDFEVLLVRAHDTAPADEMTLPATVAARLREVVTAGMAPGATPLAWLADALAEARGDYVTISDRLTWFAHWVESCQVHADDRTTTLRGLVLHQTAMTASVGGLAGVRARSAPVRAGADAFSVLEHLAEPPRASCYGFAIPRAVVSADIAVDESLRTAALRDLVLQAVERAGVTELGEIVAIRSMLEPGDLGPREETVEDLERLLTKVDQAGWRLPAGTIAGLAAERAGLSAAPAEELDRLRRLIELKDTHIGNLESRLEHLDHKLEKLQAKVEKKDAQVKKLRGKLGREPQASGDQSVTTGRLGRALGRMTGRD